MGNQQSEGCFRSTTLNKSRIQLYDMGRVTHHHIQTKINTKSQGFPFNDQGAHKKQSMSVGKIHEPIIQVHKKQGQEKLWDQKNKNGSTQSKSDYLNNETNLESAEIKKKVIFPQEVRSQTASLQRKNSTETNDSQRIGMIERIVQRKQDPLDTSGVSLTHFNLPLETIVRQNKLNEQNQQKKKRSERVKGGRKERSKQRKSQRSNQTVSTTKLNCEQKQKIKQVHVQKQKRKAKDQHPRRQQRSNEGNKKRKGKGSRTGQRIEKGEKQEYENGNCIGFAGNMVNSYGL